MKKTSLALLAACGLFTTTSHLHAGLRYNEDFYDQQQQWDQGWQDYWQNQNYQQQIQNLQDQLDWLYQQQGYGY